MSMQKTLPEVFIIKSLDLKNEENEAHKAAVFLFLRPFDDSAQTRVRRIVDVLPR